MLTIPPALERYMRDEDRARYAPGPVPVSEVLTRDHTEAALALVDWGRVKTLNHKRRISEFDFRGVHPKLAKFARRFIAECDARGWPFRVFEGYRSPERQAELKRRGHSKAGAGQSPHQFGCAVDIIHVEKPWRLSRLQYDVLGALGKEIARRQGLSVEWGGDWSFYDPVHWQLADWRDRKAAHRSLERAEALSPLQDGYHERIDARLERGPRR